MRATVFPGEDPMTLALCANEYYLEAIVQVCHGLPQELWESLAPAALGGAGGADAELPSPTLLATALFGEGPGGFIVSGSAESLKTLGERIPVVSIGRVGDDVLSIVEAGAGAGTMLTLALEELIDAHSSLAKLFS